MAAIKDIIAQVIHDISGSSAVSRKDLVVLWQELCPSGAQVIDIKDGVVLVHVDSSARLVHLNARRTELMKAVQLRCPQVKELRFRVGKIS